jgi:hypothetical protein
MADSCQTFRDAITRVEGQIADIEHVLNNPKSLLTPTMRHALLEHLATLMGEQAQLEIGLEKCEQGQANCQVFRDAITRVEGQIADIEHVLNNPLIKITPTLRAYLLEQLAILSGKKARLEKELEECNQAHP